MNIEASTIFPNASITLGNRNFGGSKSGIHASNFGKFELPAHFHRMTMCQPLEILPRDLAHLLYTVGRLDQGGLGCQ
jgi:hypothetical protein